MYQKFVTVVDFDDLALTEIATAIDEKLGDMLRSLSGRAKILSTHILPAVGHYTTYGDHTLGDAGREYNYTERGVVLVIIYE